MFIAFVYHLVYLAKNTRHVTKKKRNEIFAKKSQRIYEGSRKTHQ